MLSLLLFSALFARGEIYGDLRMGDKYLADAKIQLTCGSETSETITDAKGSFRLRVKASGKCQVKVIHGPHNAALEVVLFDKPAQYRLLLEDKDGKTTLKQL